MKTLKIIGKISIIFCIELFLFGFVQLFFPNVNVVLRGGENEELENAYLCEKDHVQELEFRRNILNQYEIIIENDYFKLKENLSIDLGRKKVNTEIGNYAAKLVNLGSILEVHEYVWIVVIYNNLLKQILMFIICNLIFIYILSILKKYKVGFANLCENFIYNISGLKLVGKKLIIFSIVIAILSIMIKPGCDCVPIARTLAIHLSGVDVYQFQNIYELYVNNMEFVMWPYNPIMLLFYSFSNILGLGYAPFYIDTIFDLLPALLLKIMNILLMNATVFGGISFLLDYRIIKKENVQKIYLWSIFNPLVYYVAILFIQLDVFPMYCVCMGLLLFVKKDFRMETGIVAAVLLSMGVFCKMQNILLIPTVLLFLFFIALKNQKKIPYMFLFFVFSFLSVLNIYVTNPVIGSFIGANKQGERIWFTVFAYAPSLYVFITVFVIVFIFLLNLFQCSSNIKQEYFLCNSLLMLGVIVLVFSASIISTPSTLIITFPAFILLMGLENNWMKRMVISLFSILCVICEMFTGVGDITAFLNYFGMKGIFETIEIELMGTAEGIRWFSLLFTVSKAAMVAYAFLFYKYGVMLLKKTEN